MSGLGWKLRRLRAMTWEEALHRARIAARDRLHPPEYEKWTPEQAYEKLVHPGRIEPPAGGDKGEFAATLKEAEGLLRGRWSYFGKEVEIGDPPQWNRNHWTGEDWPDSAGYRSGPAKYVWEAGRLTVITSLALAFAITRDERYRLKALEWMEDFSRRNPIGRGIHHSSGIEMAVRVLTCHHSLALLQPEEPPKATLGLMAQQALHCRDHLSIGSSGNNHLVAELAAMITMEPLLPESDDAFDKLQEEVLRQINPDGTSVEQSWGYIPFVWELIMLPLAAAEGHGRPVRKEVKERLRASLEFARVARLPDGATPQIGDEDEGRVLLPAEEPRLDAVGNALAAWMNAPPLSERSNVLQLASSVPLLASDGVYNFPDGGYTIRRDSGLLLTHDHGPLGFGSIAAHGHADANSLTIFLDGDPVVVDPGVYAYHEDAEARDRFRSTPYHSTVNFGGRSQSEMLGPFIWGARAETKAAGDGYECVWYTGERHWRRVSVEGQFIEIEDRISGADAEAVFVLHPSARAEALEGSAVVRVGKCIATFTGEGLGPWRLEPGEYSRRIGHKSPTLRLCARMERNSAVTRLRIGRAPGS